MDKHEPETGLSFERVVFFSDAVFAIVVTPALERRIGRRSMAVPLACLMAILLSFVSIWLAPISFIFIPVFARLLDPTSRKSKLEPATANEEASA